MFSLLFSPALALTCVPGDVPCEAANHIRDLVNEVRPNAIGDTQNGKRNTGFVRARLAEILPMADAAGCVPVGASAAAITGGSIDGIWRDIDLSTGDLLGGEGFYVGDRSGAEFTGAWNFGSIGDWGRFHLPSGKLGGLRGSDDSMLIGGIARISGNRSVAWAVHGFCGTGTDVAEVFTPYMPQLGQYISATPPEPPTCEAATNECNFAVCTDNQTVPTESCGCVDAVCNADSFCCETAWDSVCAGIALGLEVCTD